MFALWSNPEVCRFSGDASDAQGQPIHLPARSPGDSDKILEFFIGRAAEGTGVRWAVRLREGGACVGAVGLNTLRPTAEIAYHLHPDHWGSGYATEACAAVVAWCRVNLPGDTIEAFIESENTSSIQLAKRLGLKPSSGSRNGATRYRLALSDFVTHA